MKLFNNSMKKMKVNLLRKFVLVFLGVLFLGSAFGQTKPKVDLEYGFSVGSYSGTINYHRADIVIPGMDLAPEISFIYSGVRIKTDLGFGNGWVFSYSFNYKLDTLNNVVIYKNDGSHHIFTKTEEGYISPLSARYDKLEEYSPNKFRLKQKSNGLYYYFDNKVHRRVTAVENLMGLRTILAYEDSLPVTITDPAQRKIQLKWNKGHLINVIEENTGVSRVFKYSYDQNWNLILVTDPMRNIIKYSYDSANRLIAFSDKKNNPLVIEYKSDHVVKKVSTCMHDVSFTYDVTNRKTFVLENIGDEKVITTYHYDEQGRNIERKGNCCGFNVKVKYDNNNNVIEKTDGSSNTVKYSYDIHGNVVKETDAASNEVKYEFDPITFKLLSKKDELGNATSYKYNSKGNLTEVNYPLNVKELFEYNEKGLMTKFTDKNGLLTSYTYDNYGYLTSITFADGSVITYVNDALGNLLKQTDGNSNSTIYEYDLLNRPVKKINALGGISLIEYDANGNILKETNELGYSVTHEYDPLDRLVNTTTSEGIVRVIEYDNRGNVVGKIDGKGNKTSFTFNDMGKITSQTDPLGNKLNYQYDAAGRKEQESDKMGNSMTYQYNKKGQLTKKIDPLGNSYLYGYDAKGRLISETDGNGSATFFHYDALNRKIRETDPLGNEKKYMYDNMNNIIKEVDKNGSVTKYSYDNKYRLILVQKPLGQNTSYVYDGAGNILSKNTGPGVTEVFTYDKLNREIEHVFPNGEKEIKTYDAIGRLATHTFSNGNVVTYEYDKDNRQIKISDKVGVVEEKVYDKNNNIIKYLDADGKTTINHYDALNRIVKIETPGGTEIIDYNANGLPVKRTNTALESQVFTYNEVGLVIKVNDYNDAATTYSYDAMGNTISMTDAKGNTSVFTHDKLSRLISTTFADGTKTEFQLDPVGNVLQRKNAENTIEYKYDSLGRLTKKVLPGNSISEFVYDTKNRMVEAKNQHAAIKFSYDIRNRLLKERVNDIDVIAYSYDVENKTKTITYPGGRKIVEELDFMDRPVTISQNGVTVASVTYNGMKLGSQKFGNDVSTVYTHTATGRIQNISINSGNLFDFTYTYDNKNNVILKEASHHPDFSEAYAYNAANQLVFYKKGKIEQQDIPSPLDQVDYVYDVVGNYISKTKSGVSESYNSNSVNQYLSLNKGNSSTVLSYSPSGNLLTMGAMTYQYDAENRLIKAGSDINYKYDALGRRFQKTVGNETTSYFYYQDQLAVERDNSGSVTEYIYGGGKGLLFAAVKDNSVYYYHINELGSVIGITDAEGDVVEHYEYDPYGNVTFYDTNFQPATKSAIGNHILFAGRELDVETGFYYMRSRHYSPTLGRFIQRDPISFDGGTNNLYEYVSSNPVNFVDPFGLKCRTTSASWSASVGRFTAGSITSPVSLETTIGFTFESKTCETCCDGQKSSEVTTTLEASGSMTLSINVLNFFPASRGLVFALSKANLNLFGGGRVGAKLGGGYSKESKCGEVSGGGSISFSVEISGELSLTRPEGGSGEGGELNLATGLQMQVSGVVKRTATEEGDISFSNEGTDRRCSSTYVNEATFSYSISYTWNGFSVRASESYSKSSTSSGAACPPGL